MPSASLYAGRNEAKSAFGRAPDEIIPAARHVLGVGHAAAALAGAAEKVAVSLGTATPGGGFPVYGQAFTDTINEIEPTLEVKPQNTKGSTENIPLLEAGKHRSGAGAR